MNGWLRNFFHNNAYAILGAIVGLIITVTIMHQNVQGVLKEIPKIQELEKKQYAQEEINRTFKETLGRIEGKLDRALRK